MKNKKQKITIEQIESRTALMSKLVQINLKGGIGCPPPVGVESN